MAAFTQADVDALKAAIVAGKGVRQVTFGDQQVSFSSIKEMMDLLAFMEQQVNADTRQTYRLASTRKGV
jgi:hypothetical protein